MSIDRVWVCCIKVVYQKLDDSPGEAVRLVCEWPDIRLVDLTFPRLPPVVRLFDVLRAVPCNISRNDVSGRAAVLEFCQYVEHFLSPRTCLCCYAVIHKRHNKTKLQAGSLTVIGLLPPRNSGMTRLPLSGLSRSLAAGHRQDGQPEPYNFCCSRAPSSQMLATTAVLLCLNQ
jgi:hypothetical protein